MRRCVFSILFVALIFSSCVHHTPFEDEYYFQAMGDSSEIVVTTDVKKLKGSSLGANIDSNGNAKTLFDRAERLSVALMPKTLEKYPLEISDYDIYGGFEGNYGSFVTNTALSWSKEFVKEKEDGIKYYTNGNIKAAVPKSGLLLFSTYSYKKAYEKTFSERVKLIEDEIAKEMASSTTAFFVRTPQTLLDLGFELPDTVLKQIYTSYFMIDEIDGNLVMNGKLMMYDKSGAKTMNTILRNQLIQSIRRSGEKLDVKAISKYFTFDDNVVTIDSFKLEGEMRQKALSMIDKTLEGLM